MEIYNYSGVTKEYIAKTVADPDPLVEGQFLIPANATETPPPDCTNHQVACFLDNQWVIQDDYRGFIYYTASGEQHLITEIGVVPPDDALTEKPDNPNSEVSVLQQILALESQQTPRRIREAVLGVDGGWLANLDAQIAALRAQLS